jgi:putative intracellular protease/amidase
MNQPLKGKRIAVLIANNYEDLELWYPTLRLRAAGAEVQLVGEKAGQAYTVEIHVENGEMWLPLGEGDADPVGARDGTSGVSAVVGASA